MQATINAVATKFLQTELGREVVDDFYKMKQDPGWRFFHAFVSELGNHISNEVLSRRFQELPNDEKLIQLAAFSRVNTLLKFFHNPIARFEALAKRKHFNDSIGAPASKASSRQKR